MDDIKRRSEAFVWSKLSQLGCKLHVVRARMDCDLQVETMGKLYNVVVEGSKLKYNNTNSKWSFDFVLRRQSFDVSILCCMSGNRDIEVYVIPRSALISTKYVSIETIAPICYMGTYAPYYNAWHVLTTNEPVEF